MISTYIIYPFVNKQNIHFLKGKYMRTNVTTRSRLVGYKLWCWYGKKVFVFGCRCTQLATQRIFFSKFGCYNLFMLVTC
jgi:hypothetical protein